MPGNKPAFGVLLVPKNTGTLPISSTIGGPVLRSMKMVLVFLLTAALPLSAHAWGGRGHDAICEASAFLVKDKNLKEFFKFRSHTLGHLCNSPDT